MMVVLGQTAEQGFVQLWVIGHATGEVMSMFFGRPISMDIIALGFISLLYPVISERRAKKDN